MVVVFYSRELHVIALAVIPVHDSLGVVVVLKKSYMLPTPTLKESLQDSVECKNRSQRYIV